MASFVRSVFALLIATSFAVVGTPKIGTAHPSIDIIASNWKFTPATITVPVNEETTLRLTSSEGVHGIASSDLSIAQTTIMPNKFQTVKFTPKKAGTYDVHCAVVCGAGHADMILKIKVVK